MAAPSGGPWQALSSTASWCRGRGSAAVAARARRHRLTGPIRCRLAQLPHTSGKGELPGWPGCSSTILPAPAGTVQHSGPVPAARRHCLGSSDVKVRSSRPRQAPPGTAAPRWWQQGAAGAQPSCSGLVWPAPAGVIQCGGPAPVARGCRQGGSAAAAPSDRPQQAPFCATAQRWQQVVAAGAAQLWMAMASRPWQVPYGAMAPCQRRGDRCQKSLVMGTPSCQLWQAPSSVVAPHQWLGGAAVGAQLQGHPSVGSRRCRLVWRPHASGKGVPPGLPSYGSMVRQATAGAVWRGSPVPAARGCYRGLPATAAWSAQPRQVLSGTAAQRQPRGGTAGAAQLQRHCPDGLGRRHPEQWPGTNSVGALPGWPGYGGTI